MTHGAQPLVSGALELLSSGDLEVLGLLPFSSNYVFLVRVTDAQDQALAVYKPRRGERPLWDFPKGTLASREAAAFLIGEASGWGMVPPTVMRPEAPLGMGSVQLFIEHDPERHYFTLVDERPEDFGPFAAFDVVINNGDRKAGHILEDRDGRLWGVDHGVSLHVHEKLRTVIWHLADEPLGEEVESGLSLLRDGLQEGAQLRADITGLLSEREAVSALLRIQHLLASGRFPRPESDLHLPWPLV